ncbi:MAG: NHL domain-containing protein [Myxococcales bacterium]
MDGGGDAGINCTDAGDAGWSVAEWPAGDPGCGDFTGLALGPGGSVIETDPCAERVLSIDQSGAVTVLAGNGQTGDVDGSATAAEFDNPTGVAVDDAGRIYVADLCNDAIREIDIGGTVSTIVQGLTGASCPSPSPGFLGGFYIDKLSLALDGRGGLYVGRATGDRVYAGSLDGGFSVLMDGSAGVDGGPELRGVWGLAADALGDVYVAGRVTVWAITPRGDISTLAGNGQSGFVDGQGQTAEFGWLSAGISLGPSGNLYVSDEDLRRITPGGVVTTLATRSACLSFPGGLGLAVGPEDVFLNSSDTLYRLHILEGSL